MNKKRIRQMNTALLRRLGSRPAAEYLAGQEKFLRALEGENYIQRFAPLYDGGRIRCADVLALCRPELDVLSTGEPEGGWLLYTCLLYTSLGMFVGQNKIREDLAEKTRELIAVEWARPELKAAAQAWLDTLDDGNANAEPAKAYVKALEQSIATVDELANIPQFAEHAAELKAKGAQFCDCAACTLVAEILSKKEYLAKKSMWIFGGDGWAYDIGYGGLDHVLASKQDVNVFVFDTEVYSNTGGQASKASNIGQVCQFAAAGKEVKKKSLAEMAMQYGYVYVAQVAMGANPAQTIKAITEAEAYHGPSLIIGYSPCEMHSIKGGMMNCQKEMKKAVECGYWNLFRYNPEGEKKFTLDSKAPAGGYQEFLMNEARYSRLTREFPERADVLFQRNEDEAKARFEHLQKLVEMYDK